MGKQICFFAAQKDIEALINHIYCQNGAVFSCGGVPLLEDELSLIADNDYCKKHYGCNKFYVSKPTFSLCYQDYNDEKYIDIMQSEAIEFCLCNQSPKKIIDTSPVDNEFKKNGFVVIDDADAFHRQMDELMKNPTYIKNPSYVEYGFECGRFWYTKEFIDSNGKKVNKSNELNKLFDNLNRFIKKNFKQTQDKFAYIGLDAYQKYQEGVFIPCSGRNKIAVD